ncbi:hypothetical protein J2W43_000588 [Pseudomonas brassicacearum]|uniref:Uncharacterized protein n=1 Tax=Pseudomonas brassicacearum TaxID=930166 RepID=A0AAW8M4I5_9PSED|nr:hypothetical protein [Pseudomonas brassicacearum]
MANGRQLFFRSQSLEAHLGGQLDVHAQSIGQSSCLFNQHRVGIGNGLEMDVAAKPVLFSQQPRHSYQLLHGVIRRTNDAGAQEQTTDAVAAIKIQGQPHHLLRREAGPWHIAGATVDTVLAVVQAEVGQQHLQQRDTAPIRRVAVTDPHAIGGAQPFAASRAALGSTTAGARGIVFGSVGENAKLGDQFHGNLFILYACTVF